MMRPGRPTNQETFSLPPIEFFLNEARFSLTRLVSILHTSCVARASEIIEAFKQRLKDDGKELDEVYGKLNKLRSAYNQFRDLTDREKVLRKRMIRAVALVGNKFSTADLAEITADELGTLFNTEALRKDLNLWEAIADVLDHVGETRIFEVKMILSQFQIYATRQAIESAIETHQDVFKVRKQGREKYVSLKKDKA